MSKNKGNGVTVGNNNNAPLKMASHRIVDTSIVEEA